jgi:hypothetical protein
VAADLLRSIGHPDGAAHRPRALGCGNRAARNVTQPGGAVCASRL